MIVLSWDTLYIIYILAMLGIMSHKVSFMMSQRCEGGGREVKLTLDVNVGTCAPSPSPPSLPPTDMWWIMGGIDQHSGVKLNGYINTQLARVYWFFDCIVYCSNFLLLKLIKKIETTLDEQTNMNVDNLAIIGCQFCLDWSCLNPFMYSISDFLKLPYYIQIMIIRV